MGRPKKIAYPVENDAPIYVHKRIIDLINKKAIITKFNIDSSQRKIVIEYKSKKHKVTGKVELNDLGPDKNNI